MAVSVTIRAARSSDSKGMGIVHVYAWQAAYRGVMTDDYLDGLRVEERAAMWERAISAPAGPHVLVAAVDDEVIGFASFGAERNQLDVSDVGQLYAINLDPAHWGKRHWAPLAARSNQLATVDGFSRGRIVGSAHKPSCPWSL